MKKKILIEGMKCRNCVAHVTEALIELEDSNGVEVNLDKKYAIVETDVKDEIIKDKIEDIGYDVIKIENI
jgi:copper chaperone